MKKENMCGGGVGVYFLGLVGAAVYFGVKREQNKKVHFIVLPSKRQNVG